MNEILTTSNILFTLTILGVIFSIYRSYRTPQEELDKKMAVGDAISEKELSTKATILAQKEAEGKAGLLAQQVQWEKEANEKKFTEFGIRLDASLALAQNHIHTVDVKVDNLTIEVSSLKNEIIKLSTIMSERLPKKV
ncbi:hypothetical protein M0R04_12670 [Candidatus Dojkabacteria bacterium]|jgi:hypothetical protein|nr:hypothetical protein [Candidatus Dojkabacteria bacterium]